MPNAGSRGYIWAGVPFRCVSNAPCHADYRLASPVVVKQSAQRLETSNPGGFIGGISPENILHHAPVSRNSSLVEALVRLRLVNRSNLGVARIYTALLIEGKEPPLIEDLGGIVRVTLRSSDLSALFWAFVAEQEQQGRTICGRRRSTPSRAKRL